MLSHYKTRTNQFSDETLLSILLKSVYVPKHILTDKCTVFTADLMKQLMKTTGIRKSHATIKHAQTIDLIERSHAEVKKTLKIIVHVDQPQRGQYFDIAVMTLIKTYQSNRKQVFTNANFPR